MFGRKMTKFEDWSDTSEGDPIDSLTERSKEIRNLIEIDYVKALENIVNSQDIQKTSQNKKNNVVDIPLKIGTKVYVKRMGILPKLDPRYLGPYKIVEITKNNNYILENVLKEKMEDTYPLSRLKVMKDPREENSNDEFYEIKKILDHRKEHDHSFKYLVRWKGFSEDYDTWEPVENFQDNKIIRNYWKSIKNKHSDKTYKLNFSNTILIIFIFFFLFASVVGNRVDIFDQIYWCDQVDHNTPVLNLIDACSWNNISTNVTLNTNHDYNDVAILSKDPFEVLGKGIECLVQVIQITTYTNFFFAKSKETKITNLKLTSDQCRLMIKTNLCNNRRMICEEGQCIYDGTPSGQFGYLTTHKEEGQKCILKNRLIKAKSIDSKLFGKNCFAENRTCQMESSIIVWDDIVHRCPFSLVKTANLTHFSNGLFFDKQNKLAFQVTSKENNCQRNMLRTTQGLYLVLNKPINRLPLLIVFELANSSSTHIDLRATHELMLAENDGAYFELNKRIEMNRIKICKNVASLFNIIPEKYNVITDYNGNERIYVARHGAIYIPSCLAINNFTIVKTEKCVEEFSINFILNNQTFTGYLKTNRLITSLPTYTSCKQKTIYFPYSKQFIYEDSKNITVNKQVHLIHVDKAGNRDIELNFPHLNTLLKPIDVLLELQFSKPSESLNNGLKNLLNKEHFNKQEEINDIATGGNFIKEKLHLVSNITRNFVSESKKFASEFLGKLFFLLIILLLCVTVGFGLFFAMKWNQRNDQQSDNSHELSPLSRILIESIRTNQN